MCIGICRRYSVHFCSFAIIKSLVASPRTGSACPFLAHLPFYRRLANGGHTMEVVMHSESIMQGQNALFQGSQGFILPFLNQGWKGGPVPTSMASSLPGLAKGSSSAGHLWSWLSQIRLLLPPFPPPRGQNRLRSPGPTDGIDTIAGYSTRHCGGAARSCTRVICSFCSSQCGGDRLC